METNRKILNIHEKFFNNIFIFTYYKYFQDVFTFKSSKPICKYEDIFTRLTYKLQINT